MIFFVEKSSSRNDIGIYIFFEPDLSVCPTGIDGAIQIEKALGTEAIADWSVVQEGIVTNVYKTDSVENSFVAFKIVGKKNTVASIELLVDILNCSSDKIPIHINFFPIKRKRGVMGILRDYVVPGALLGVLGISGMFVKDLFMVNLKTIHMKIQIELLHYC